MKTKLSEYLMLLLVFIAIILICISFMKKIGSLNNKLVNEIKYKNALIDTLKSYRNLQGELVAEKLTLQTTIKFLEKNNSDLSKNQKELLLRIKESDKDKNLLNAALIKLQIKIDSIVNNIAIIDTNAKTIRFIDSLKNIKYDMTIFNVVGSNVLNKKPYLYINNIALPNTQYIEFKWRDDKKLGYPLSFSISNSNEYVEVDDIVSYSIPFNREDIRPTTWQKIGKFFKTSGGTLLIIGVSGITGIGAGILFF